MSLPLLRAQITEETHVAYLDSWADRTPSQVPKRYTTIIALHGVGFNSAVWTPLLPSLPSSTTRFLAYNQRGYKESSPAFKSEKEGGTDATAAYLGDLLDFIRFAVDELKLAGVDDESGQGGIVLLCWSKGTLLALSLLSLLHASPPSPTSFLSSFHPRPLSHLTTHLRSIILFEPPGSALARPPTADYTEAMASVSPPHHATEAEFAQAFAGWIGSYSSPSSSDPPSGLAALSPELFAEAWEPPAVAHGFSWRLSSLPSEVAQLSKHALAPPLSPAVSVGLIYGARTNGYCLDAAQVIGGWWGLTGEEEEGDKEEGEKEKRKTGIKRLQGANHFAFVHEPKGFWAGVEDLIAGLV